MRKLIKIIFILSIICLGAVAISVFAGCDGNSTYSLIYNAEQGGVIEGNVNQSVHKGESGTEVVAVPYDGYEFVKWSDGVTSQSRTDGNVNHDINVTARFAKTEYFTVTYEAGEGGSIDGLTTQTIKSGENGQQVVAVPDEGYRFVKWSDKLTECERTEKDVTTDISVKAVFEKKVYTVTYNLIYGGWLLDGQKQYDESITVNVEHGSDSITVTAKPYYYHVFMNWSDGLTTEERTDKNITSDMTITAYFGCEAKYYVNNGVGGRIEGSVEQTVRAQEKFEEVKAVPADGYVFTGWSDLKTESSRQDIATYSLEMVAYFEPIEKTFRYDYGELAAPLENTVTLNRNNLQAAQFAVPSMTGYDFCGWFTDKTYTTKVVNEDGVYMLGYRSFALETDTLYAKWQVSGEQELKNSVLLVFVDEIDATIFSTVVGKDIEVKHKMTGVEYELCSQIAVKFSEYLNEWFKEFECEVRFEVDSYYTTILVNEESVDGGTAEGNTWYDIEADKIPEVFTSGLDKKYISILTTENFEEYELPYLLHRSGGVASKKYGAVFMDSMLRGYIDHNKSLHTVIDEMKNGDFDEYYTQDFLLAYLHEFTHTCELYYKSIQIIEYHRALTYHSISENDYSNRNRLNTTKLYLLNRAQTEDSGELGGIPTGFWKHETLLPVVYWCDFGTIMINGEIGSTVSPSGVTKYVAYGSDLTVEAVPKEGYKFVKWSDGVTSAIRIDTDIVTYFNVLAICVKDKE